MSHGNLKLTYILINNNYEILFSDLKKIQYSKQTLCDDISQIGIFYLMFILKENFFSDDYTNHKLLCDKINIINNPI